MNFCGLNLRSKIVLGPGAFSPGQDYSNVGLIITKTVTKWPNEGNLGTTLDLSSPVMTFNRMGLPNPGIANFIRNDLNEYIKHGCPVIVSIFAENSDELLDMVSALSFHKEVVGVEINVSCPNYKVTDIGEEDIIKVRDYFPELIIGLKVGISDIRSRWYECAEIDYVSCANSIPTDKYSDGLANGIVGGISGPIMKEPVKNLVYHIKDNTGYHMNVIAFGGVESESDVMVYLAVGANLVGVVSKELKNPGFTNELARKF